MAVVEDHFLPTFSMDGYSLHGVLPVFGSCRARGKYRGMADAKGDMAGPCLGVAGPEKKPSVIDAGVLETGDRQ